MKRIPSATYRVQFNRDFALRQAGEILDYLAELGISEVYASPLLEAGPESTHGYDTCNFGKPNPNLGAPGDFDRFADALKERGLGLLLDFVPNHMSASTANAWWADVLEKGRDSAYAGFFDIQWRPENRSIRGKVLLPILEDHYGMVLESGKLRMMSRDGSFFLSYHKLRLPIDRATVPAEAFNDQDAFLNEINGRPGEARSFQKLDSLLERQHYRLAYWRAASEEINYRRFFDVTELAAVRMEVPEVFQAAHELVFEWVRSGSVTGLRIDHPDGLRDPRQYLERLQAGAAALYASAKAMEPARANPVEERKEERPLYVAVEKILCGDERLPRDWPADGTTGYDFLNRLNGLFVNGRNALAAQEVYREFTANNVGVEEIIFRSRKQSLERTFASEVKALTYQLREITRRTQGGRDFTFSELRRVLEGVAASFPVYRTYVTESVAQISEQDRGVIENTMKLARQRAGAEGDAAIFDFVERLLLLKPDEALEEEAKQNARDFVMRFQQLTGPAMAKGLEDTAFYRFNRLVSLNEVGSDLEKFGVTPEEFHAANGATMAERPHTMLASATHDTKRGEDLRARINVLSELLFEWRDAARQWSRGNREKKTMVQNAPAPDANDEYLFYQMLIGAWPVQDDREMLKTFRPRLTEFMLKAAKEAKVHTSWTEPNAEYEKALREFVEAVLSDERNASFIEDARRFAGKVAFFGRFNSLAQALLKMTSPGVPDFYQGTELWDLSMVDPDNRRPVDYGVRQRLLAEMKKKYEGSQGGGVFFSQLLLDQQPGGMKMFLTWRTLNFRKLHHEVFERGNYIPLTADGREQEHVCAFARVWREKEFVVVVPRLVAGLTNNTETLPIGGAVWKDTVVSMPPGGARTYRNVFTMDMLSTKEHAGGDAIEVGQVFKQFPVALLEKI